MASIDLNCDLGEGAGDDAAMMRLVSSANIACGGHAGDAESMRQAVDLALEHGVVIGAHPSYPDRANFGRADLDLPARQLVNIIAEQVEALSEVAAACGAAVRYLKPHGALYNRACRDPAVADAVAQACRLPLLGLAGSALERSAVTHGLAFVGEFFADRCYEADGSLTPRSAGASSVIHDPSAAASRVVRMLTAGHVVATDGSTVNIRAQTVCVHGDGRHAVDILRAVRAALDQAKIAVRPAVADR